MYLNYLLIIKHAFQRTNQVSLVSHTQDGGDCLQNLHAGLCGGGSGDQGEDVEVEVDGDAEVDDVDAVL